METYFPHGIKMQNRVEVTGLRTSPLPHHRTCGSASGGYRATRCLNFPCIVFLAAALEAGLDFELLDFFSREKPVLQYGPLDQNGFFHVDFSWPGTEGIFLYRGLRELAKRLFCRN